MSDDDTERYGQLVPSTRNRMGEKYDESRALDRDARMLDPGWGLANLVETFRNRSAARLMKARTKNVDAWRRFTEELVRLGEALIEREKMRRRLQNLDAILDGQEAHEGLLEQIWRDGEINDALAAGNKAKKRLLDSERALKPEKEEKPEPKEPKEEKKKVSDPADRIVEGFENRQYLKNKRDELIKRVLDTAQAQGISPDDDDIRREIENIKSDFNKAISESYGR